MKHVRERGSGTDETVTQIHRGYVPRFGGDIFQRVHEDTSQNSRVF